MQRLVVMFAVWMLGACSDGTRIRLEVTADASLAIDSYQLKIEQRVAIAEPRDVLELLVDDAMADTTAVVEVWGLSGGKQVAYGTGTVVPQRNGTVATQIALAAIACGTWCQPGERACASSGGGDGTIECVQGSDGCLQWSAIAACGDATPFCSNGMCAATCNDECTVGEKACDGAAAVRACGQYDSDECLDWSPVTACGSNQTCAAGACVTMQACSDGTACNDGNQCTEYDECNSGVCAGEQTECEAAPPECVADKLRLHGSTGTCSPTSGECSYSYVDATCAISCHDGACHQRVAAGGENSCALGATGGVTCWGEMTGDGPESLMNTFSVGREHACGMTVTGFVQCWSTETFGNVFGECDVPAGSYTTVAAGGAGFTCAVRSTGTLLCWGNDVQGVLTEPTGTFNAIATGFYHACAIRTTGTVACWGYNNAGQSSAPGGDFTKVAAGYYFSCGIRDNRTLACWGTITAPPAGAYVDVAAGYYHACALRSDGALRCWGQNTYGESSPPSGTYTSVAVGSKHSCATRSDGKIVCWGDTADGATTVPAGF